MQESLEMYMVVLSLYLNIISLVFEVHLNWVDMSN